MTSNETKIALMVSLVVQVCAIILLNLARGYFLVFHQAIHLAPELMIYAAPGLDHLFEQAHLGNSVNIQC